MNFQAKDSWATILVQSGDTTTHDKPKKPKKAASAADHSTQQAVVQQKTEPEKPAQAEGHSFIFYFFVTLIIINTIAWVMNMIFMAANYGDKLAKRASGEHEEAEYGIPHCHFEKTPEGFIIKFRKLPWKYYVGGNDIIRAKGNGTHAAFYGIVFKVLQHLTIGQIRRFFLLVIPTKIEVTKDTVFIGGKKLLRADFGNFIVYDTIHIKGKLETMATLGYQYGSKKFPFGGAWLEEEATAVAAGLNHYLRSAPEAGGEKSPAPEVLRQQLAQDETF